MSKYYINTGKKNIELTNPDKIIFPKDKITKQQFVQYYKDISSLMIPLIKNHPVMMHRFPNGINQEGFYHKDAPAHFPEWIKIIPVKSESQNKMVHYVVINNAATLVYLANYGNLTTHIWTSKIDKLDYPDRMIFDLDPSDKTPFSLICDKAKELRKLLKKLGLNSFAMTTGSRGIHVVVPLIRKFDFDYIREYARVIAQYMVEDDPDNLTIEIRKNKRGNRIFLDFLRNSFGATSVAPYSIRAKNGAPIATPLHWDELDDPKLTSQKYNISNIFQRIKKTKDPWKNFYKEAKTPKIK